MRLPVVLRERGEVDVVALGENSLDFVAVTADGPGSGSKRSLTTFGLQTGGQAATAAIGCARLGARVRYAGTFGADEWGSRSRAALEAAGVEVMAVERPGVPARIAVVIVDAAGDRTVLEHRDSRLLMTGAELDRQAIVSARVLLVDAAHPDASLHAARWARAAGTISICDVDRMGPLVAELLAEIDVVVVPEPFVADWTGTSVLADGLKVMRERCPRASAIVATRGPLGSLAWCAGALVETPACLVEVVDTTGAGDAFRAGLAVALLRMGPEPPLEAVLSFAHAVAALNCRAVGAQTSLPTIDEVLAHATSGANLLSN
jgi:sugar/nucleoside kinase (ribokinase family)